MNVSVIIPVYNAEKFILKAIDSCLVLPQVKEIVVVDDGYKDKSIELIKEHSLKHPSIKIYRHPNGENRGAGPSRNLGIEMATQDYISFLDADDVYLPNRFVKDQEIFEQIACAQGCYNAIGVHFYSALAKEQYYKTFAKDLTTVNALAKPNPQNLFDGLLGVFKEYGYFHLDGFTVKKNALLSTRLKFDPLRLHQDTAFLIKLSYLLSLHPANISTPVALRGVHLENRITANNSQSSSKKASNRLIMWKNIQEWSTTKDLLPYQSKYIQQQVELYKHLSNKSSSVSKFALLLIKDPHIINNPGYLQIHNKYFGEGKISLLLYKVLVRVLLRFQC